MLLIRWTYSFRARVKATLCSMNALRSRVLVFLNGLSMLF